MPAALVSMSGSPAIGAYYTPPDVVDFMCREALATWLSGDGAIAGAAAADLVRGLGADSLGMGDARRIRERLLALRAIDPACGCGAFLVGLLRVVAQAWGALHERLARGAFGAPGAGSIPLTWLTTRGLYGMELDPESAAIARGRVAEALAALSAALGAAPGAQTAPAGGDEPARIAALLRDRITVGDALAAQPADSATPAFDIVLVNPPYENMVAMAARDAGGRRRLRATYGTARGGFDLFVPFIERSLALLGPRGVLAALTPDKLLSAPYATALRDRYRERADLLAMADLTGARPFAAGVYPVVTIGRRREARGGHDSPGRPGDPGKPSGPAASGPTVRIYEADGRAVPSAVGAAHGAEGDGRIRFSHEAPVAVLDRAGNRWAALLDPECDTITRAIQGLPRLAELAEIFGAATVAEAYAWQAAILDDGRHLWTRDPERYAPFLVSGSIGPGAHTWAERPVRYLGRSYHEPVLDTHHAAVSARRRRQILAGKVILSGLSRRPTCVWDRGGLAAGKSTVLLIPRAGVPGAELATVLNSDDAARTYRLLFGALSLSGGYLRFGPPQMRSLPVPWAGGPAAT